MVSGGPPFTVVSIAYIASGGVQAIVLGTDGHLFLDVCRRVNAVKT